MVIRCIQHQTMRGSPLIYTGRFPLWHRGPALFFGVLLHLFAAMWLPAAAEGQIHTMNSAFGMERATSIVFLRDATLAEVDSMRDIESGTAVYRSIGSQIPIDGETAKTMSSLGATKLFEPQYPWSGVVSTFGVLDAKGNILAIINVWAKFSVFSVTGGTRLKDGRIVSKGDPSKTFEGSHRSLLEWSQSHDPQLKPKSK